MKDETTMSNPIRKVPCEQVMHRLLGGAVAAVATVLLYALLNLFVWLALFHSLFSFRIIKADLHTAVVLARETQPDWPLVGELKPRKSIPTDPDWIKMLGDPAAIDATKDTGTLGKSDLSPSLASVLAPVIGDSARLYLFQSNPGGQISDSKSSVPAPNSVSVVLEVSNSTVEAATSPPRRFALCIEASGNWLTGGRVDARMFEVAETGCLLESDRGPFQVLRATGIVPRPTGAYASEEEVTERFLEYVDRLLRATPTDAAAARLSQGTRAQTARALTSLLMAQLGTSDRPSQEYVNQYSQISQAWGRSALAAPLVHYGSVVKRSSLVWARRFNGSDLWGWIQVFTVFVGCWVTIECTVRWAGYAPCAPAAAWEAEYAMAGYGLWLMPTLGFTGTVVGLILAVGESGRVLTDSRVDKRAAVQEIANNLATAFDTTFVGLVCTAIAYCIYSASKAAREQYILSGGAASSRSSYGASLCNFLYSWRTPSPSGPGAAGLARPDSSSNPGDLETAGVPK